VTAPDPGAATHEAPSGGCVSISLVTHNGLPWLPGCWRSLREQELAWHELLVIDNASTDGSAAWIAEHALGDGRVRLTHSNTNLGFARAHNLNIRRSRCEAVLVLNQDTELDPAFLRHAVRALRDRPGVAAVQGRLLRLEAAGHRGTTIDTTGLEMYRNRKSASRAHGHPDSPAHRSPGPLFGADGAAPLYRRSALMHARLPATGGGWEVFDEDFFMYKEDVDLAWRLNRLGWSAWYEPRALGWHARGARGPLSRSIVGAARAYRRRPARVRALSWRNQRLMMVKNEPLGHFLRDLPWIATRDLLELGFVLVTDPARLRAIPALLAALPGAMRKRRVLDRRIGASTMPPGPAGGSDPATSSRPAPGPEPFRNGAGEATRLDAHRGG
jgi:GT2 family glycosyltransferase